MWAIMKLRDILSVHCSLSSLCLIQKHLSLQHFRNVGALQSPIDSAEGRPQDRAGGARIVVPGVVGRPCLEGTRLPGSSDLDFVVTVSLIQRLTVFFFRCRSCLSRLVMVVKVVVPALLLWR